MVSVIGCEVATWVIVADGVKEGVASAGSPVTVNVMGLVNVPFEGATIRLNLAGRPAFTVAEEVGAVMVKSVTSNCNADVVPPTGAGLFTATFSVPPAAKSLASRAAVREVELTKVVLREVPFT